MRRNSSAAPATSCWGIGGGSAVAGHRQRRYHRPGSGLGRRGGDGRAHGGGCPWIFAQWRDPGLAVDRAEVWRRLCDYIVEDFAPAPALVRIKVLAPYFARNFFFGHTFFKGIHSAPDLATARRRGDEFLDAAPQLCAQVSVSGI